MSTQIADTPIAGGLFDNDLRERGGYNYGGYIPGYDYMPERPKRPTRLYVSGAAGILGVICASLLVIL